MYKLEDVWLAIQGWDDEIMFNVRVNKTLTGMLAEVTNRSGGGKGGVLNYFMQLFPDEQDSSTTIGELTPEQISATIKKYQEMRAKRREQEKLNGRGTQDSN